MTNFRGSKVSSQDITEILETGMSPMSRTAADKRQNMSNEEKVSYTKPTTDKTDDTRDNEEKVIISQNLTKLFDGIEQLSILIVIIITIIGPFTQFQLDVLVVTQNDRGLRVAPNLAYGTRIYFRNYYQKQMICHL